jgi:hypothetical protein
MAKTRRREKVPVKAYTAGVYARRSAGFLLKEITNGPHKEHLIPSFISALCTGIESLINDCYIDFFHRKLGLNYRGQVNVFLYMRFKEKLATLVLLASNFEYQLNEDDQGVKGIMKLVDLRNNLLHGKQHWYSATLIEEDSGTNLLYDNPNTSDFYRDHEQTVILVKDLKDYMKLFKRFLPDFWNLGGSIGTAGKFARKNYKPKSWFKKIEKS